MPSGGTSKFAHTSVTWKMWIARQNFEHRTGYDIHMISIWRFTLWCGSFYMAFTWYRTCWWFQFQGHLSWSICSVSHFNFWTPRMRISYISFNHLKKVFASKVMFKPWELVESQLQTFWIILAHLWLFWWFDLFNLFAFFSLEPRNGRRKHRRHPQSYWRLDQHWRRVRCRSHVQWRFWSRASTEAWQTWGPFNMQGLLSLDSLDPNLCELEVMGDALMEKHGEAAS